MYSLFCANDLLKREIPAAGAVEVISRSSELFVKVERLLNNSQLHGHAAEMSSVPASPSFSDNLMSSSQSECIVWYFHVQAIYLSHSIFFKTESNHCTETEQRMNSTDLYCTFVIWSTTHCSLPALFEFTVNCSSCRCLF